MQVKFKGKRREEIEGEKERRGEERGDERGGGKERWKEGGKKEENECILTHIK